MPRYSSNTPDAVYLWLCCEGWMKFGPFEWLSFDACSQSYLDQHGKPVATIEDDTWSVPGERWEGWTFRHPVITSSLHHPAPSSGGLPVK